MQDVQASSFASSVTFDTMQQSSNLVVIATVGKQSTRGTTAKTETHTLLKVSKYLKGSGQGNLVLRQIGEATPIGTKRIKGDAQLVPGQRVILYLRTSKDTRYSQFVHLTLLGYSAYDLIVSKDKSIVLARPHNRDAMHGNHARTTLGRGTTLATLEARLVVGVAR